MAEPRDLDIPTGWVAAVAMWNACLDASPPPAWTDERQLSERAFAAANAGLRQLGFTTELGTMSRPKP